MTQQRIVTSLLLCVASVSSNLQAAAPTVVRGPNEQSVEVQAPIINLGAATSGSVSVQVSIGSLHEGTTMDGGNSQSVYVGASEGGEFSVMNIGVSSGGESACANTMIGSIGSTSCMK